MLRRLTQTTGQTLNSFRRLAAADRVSSFRFMQRVLFNQIAINHRDNRCNQRAAPHLSTDPAEATQPDLATHQFHPAQNILLHHQVHQIASFIFKKEKKKREKQSPGLIVATPFWPAGPRFILFCQHPEQKLPIPAGSTTKGRIEQSHDTGLPASSFRCDYRG